MLSRCPDIVVLAQGVGVIHVGLEESSFVHFSTRAHSFSLYHCCC